MFFIQMLGKLLQAFKALFSKKKRSLVEITKNGEVLLNLTDRDGNKFAYIYKGKGGI